MARKLDMSDYYRKKGTAMMPVRWMAPECLRQGKFTTESDVWSFGVLIYEVYSFGDIPYPAMSNQQVYESVVNGHVMGQPPNTPDAVYHLMSQVRMQQRCRPWSVTTVLERPPCM